MSQRRSSPYARCRDNDADHRPLRLRPLSAGDADFLVDTYSRQEVQRFIGLTPQVIPAREERPTFSSFNHGRRPCSRLPCEEGTQAVAAPVRSSARWRRGEARRPSRTRHRARLAVAVRAICRERRSLVRPSTQAWATLRPSSVAADSKARSSASTTSNVARSTPVEARRVRVR